MPLYKVRLVSSANSDPKSHDLEIRADDVEISGLISEGDSEHIADDTAYFNFTKQDDSDETSTTVAAIPFREVRFVTT